MISLCALDKFDIKLTWLDIVLTQEFVTFEQRSYSQLPESLIQHYKYQDERQIPHQLSFPA